MSIKKKIFVNNLKKHLKVDDLNEINESHSKKIMDYIKLHHNEDIVSELITSIPNSGFTAFAYNSIKSMRAIIRELEQAGQNEISVLENIIEQLIDLLKNENISSDDKKKVHNHIKKFSDILENQLRENADLRRKIFGGVFLVVSFSVLFAAGIAYRSIGGQNDEVILQAGERFVELT
jgi:hypothetical protein